MAQRRRNCCHIGRWSGTPQDSACLAIKCQWSDKIDNWMIHRWLRAIIAHKILSQNNNDDSIVYEIQKVVDVVPYRNSKRIYFIICVLLSCFYNNCCISNGFWAHGYAMCRTYQMLSAFPGPFMLFLEIHRSHRCRKTGLRLYYVLRHPELRMWWWLSLVDWWAIWGPFVVFVVDFGSSCPYGSIRLNVGAEFAFTGRLLSS